MESFSALFEKARIDGWASATLPDCPESDVLRRIKQSGVWAGQIKHLGHPEWQVLEPVEKHKARPNSMSAATGLAAQPLHTDGAHLLSPPDFVVLYAETPSPVPTWLYEVPNKHLAYDNDLAHGLFTVHTGKTSFLATATELSEYHGSRLRFDPICMSPSDARARRGASLLTSMAENDKTRFDWNEPWTLLIINNRVVLHGRGDASADPDRVLLRLTIQMGTD